METSAIFRNFFPAEDKYEAKRQRERKALQPILLKNRLKNPFRRLLYKLSGEYRRSTNLDVWATAKELVNQYQVSMADLTPSERKSFREESRKDRHLMFSINQRERERIIRRGRWCNES